MLSQAVSVNLVPLDMTRFSRQLVPDLASCSLSEEKHDLIRLIQNTLPVSCSNQNAHKMLLIQYNNIIL